MQISEGGEGNQRPGGEGKGDGSHCPCQCEKEEDVAVIVSKDGNKLSEEQVKTWVDNFRASLNKKKQRVKEPDPKDKDQE